MLSLLHIIYLIDGCNELKGDTIGNVNIDTGTGTMYIIWSGAHMVGQYLKQDMLQMIVCLMI